MNLYGMQGEVRSLEVRLLPDVFRWQTWRWLLKQGDRDAFLWGMAGSNSVASNARQTCDSLRWKGCMMKISQLRIEKIENYDPFNERAKGNGMVTEWVARNKWGIAVAFGNTKAECMADARRYCKRQTMNMEGKKDE